MTGIAIAAGSAGAQALADSLPGNLVLIGISIVGLLGAGALLGSARSLRAERRDPLNDRHYIDI